MTKKPAKIEPKRPPGRPTIAPEERAVVGSIRLTPAQWGKLERLGGSAWLRERIDKAREAARMKLTDIPHHGSKFLDVDGIPVAMLPDGSCIAFDKGNADGESRPYSNVRKAGLEGDALSRDEFVSWLMTGRNRFDRSR